MDIFITPQWLAQNLNNSSLQIIDGSWHMPATKRNAKEEYLHAHIPNAIFFDIDEIADHETDLPHMLPTQEQFNEQISALGIDPRKTQIIYDSVGLFSAPRVWWTLKTFGFQNVKILQGGLPQWQAQNLPLEKGSHKNPLSQPKVSKDQTAIVDFVEMIKVVESRSCQVLDARPYGRFTGEVPEPRPGLRGGHMPGAISIPVSELMAADGFSFKSNEELQKLFQSKGVDLAKPIITTCGSGVTAATLLLALQMTHANHVRLYDGSWSQWGKISGGSMVVDNLNNKPKA